MPYIQLNDTQYPLRIGAMRVGAVSGADIRLPGGDDPAAVALLEVGADNSASIRRGMDGALVSVNGVQLGVEPVPLLHGDKIEMAGHELLFGDDRKGGSTQYVPSMAAFAQGGGGVGLAAARANAPTAATGGLLRSLVDGREYPVPDAGLVIGRDASCDVVVPSSEVSRRHASIVATPAGYELRDSSTNGVWVNGTRITGQATLGRGDVVRIGGEEFRFYADKADLAAMPAAPAAPVAPPRIALPNGPELAPIEMGLSTGGFPDLEPLDATSLPPLAALPEPEPMPMPVAHAPVAPAAPAAPAWEPPPAPPAPPVVPAAPSAPAAAVRPALATLEVVNEGLLKGQRFEIRHPLVHVGRGEHNDIVVVEESVSDSHAKIQKRDGAWYVTDMGSTNGTYVAGRRAEGEMELAPGADVRFGGVKLRFQPGTERADEGKGTRVIAGAQLEAAKRAATAPPSAPKRPAPAAAPAPAKKASPVLLVVVVLVVIAAAAAYFLKGR